MNEFDIIERYFLPLACGRNEVAGFKDDAAVLNIPDGYELVVTSDTLNEGVHFMVGESASNIAHKALRVNLSDLASMGANSLSYQLNIAFPSAPDESWLADFSSALLEDNDEFGVFCSGGDTTSIKGDCLSISITALGVIPKGEAVRRGGAKNGDVIIVTGSVGDAYLGLKVLQEGLGEHEYAEAVERYRVPKPRNNACDLIRKYANAATDISDGLIADIVNIAKASGLGAEIDLDKLVFSKDVQHALDNGVVNIDDVVRGGDDYELILAVSPNVAQDMIRELERINLNHMVIGKFTGDGLLITILDNTTYCIDDKNVGCIHF